MKQQAYVGIYGSSLVGDDAYGKIAASKSRLFVIQYSAMRAIGGRRQTA